MSEQKAHLIDPRDFGHRPLTLDKPVFDTDAVTRAERALASMSGSFGQWLEDEIAAVQTARAAADEAGWSAASIEQLHIAAHNLKGLGTTYEYPLATQLGASLCRLIETNAGRAEAARDPALARAHVDALRAIARARVRTDEHPVGAALLQELEARVAGLGVAPG
jgi:hypothetical protein